MAKDAPYLYKHVEPVPMSNSVDPFGRSEKFALNDGFTKSYVDNHWDAVLRAAELQQKQERAARAARTTRTGR